MIIEDNFTFRASGDATRSLVSRLNYERAAQLAIEERHFSYFGYRRPYFNTCIMFDARYDVYAFARRIVIVKSVDSANSVDLRLV